MNVKFCLPGAVTIISSNNKVTYFCLIFTRTLDHSWKP